MMLQQYQMTRIKKLALLITSLILMIAVLGCSGGFARLKGPVQSKPLAYDPNLKPVVQPKVEQASKRSDEGSLWEENAPLASMFSDQKARQVGDIVTIKIVESSTATNKASTDTDRGSSMSASLDAFFNAEKRFPADQPFFNPFSQVAGGLDSQFQGSGTTKRSGDLNAYISALVTQILPNGNLVLVGSREVLINNENQIIQLSGVVRPRDIDPDNQILSTYLADARISYSGTGIVNDRQKPGWLSKIMMTVWPF